MKIPVTLGVLVILAALTSCTLAPKNTGAGFMFALSPIQSVAKNSPIDQNIVVSLPVTAPQLDTYRIALLKNASAWDYYAGARWADFLPVLVQDNLTKTINESRIFKTALTDESSLSGDYVLKTEIHEFQAEYSATSAVPVIKIKINVMILSRGNSTSFTLASQQLAKSNSLTAIQAAFSVAFDEVQRQMIIKLNNIK